MFVVAIPSYKRARQLQQKTLSCLHDAGVSKELVDVFVIEEEYEEYLAVLNKEYYNRLIVGHLGLVPQREFIQHYYPVGTKIVSLDDDVELIDLSFTAYESVDAFFTDAFAKCEEKGAYLWSVYPVYNPFFRKDRADLTEGLSFCIGAFYGYINRDDADLRIDLIREGNKEDVERSILYWLKDGKTLRFNKIGFKTKYYGVGGLGGLKDRLETMKRDAIAIQAKYPLFTRIKIRKNGLYEIVLKEPIANKKLKETVDDCTPQQIIKVNPSDDTLLEVYNLLENVTVPCLDNGRGRSSSFGRHRAMTLGMIRARASKKYGLSHNSKKYPELYKAVMKFGKMVVPFEFNAVHINHNVVCPRHLDAYNSGKSCLISLGDYEGCNLVIEGYGEYNTNCSPLIFDGSKSYHYNTPLLSGNKYSLVFFTNSH